MDSLANYGSEGENSDHSEEKKMSRGRVQVSARRASDVNYEPVQMDMSEDSNNNISSNDSGDEQHRSPPVQSCSSAKSDSSRKASPDQRRSDGDRLKDSRRDKSDRHRHNEKTSRKSHDEHRRDSEHRERRPRDEDRKSRDDERKKERSSSNRDDRREEKSEKSHRNSSSSHRSDRKERLRERDRRHSRNDRTKDRHRDEHSHYKDKDRTRSRSRSKDRSTSNYKPMSYREEKGRNKLAQLEKLGIELKAPEGALTSFGIEPNFYNPLATASQGKYAEQIQKRKLLWANKAKPEVGKAPAAIGSTNTWVGTTFTDDQDGKMTAKFKRLMGIKSDVAATPAPGQKPDILKKQEEMFNNMEQQYEVARATTHTQRGVGLGYASGGYQISR